MEYCFTTIMQFIDQRSSTYQHILGPYNRCKTTDLYILFNSAFIILQGIPIFVDVFVFWLTKNSNVHQWPNFLQDCLKNVSKLRNQISTKNTMLFLIIDTHSVLNCKGSDTTTADLLFEPNVCFTSKTYNILILKLYRGSKLVLVYKKL